MLGSNAFDPTIRPPYPDHIPAGDRAAEFTAPPAMACVPGCLLRMVPSGAAAGFCSLSFEPLNPNRDMAEEADPGAARLDFLKKELSPDLDVIRRVGTGRMAEVYLARQKPLDRLVAVKVLAKTMADDSTARARFEREAKASASLDHRNAVEVYRFGYLSDGVPFLVMQYVKGGTLEDKIAAEGPLPVATAKRILLEVADALAAAHSHGFVHRDVRPENVLCDLEKSRVLLSDFGLAGILPQGRDSDPRLTRAGETIGTSGYLSPEQIRGEDPTEGTDIYALGLLGYEILTGEGPFSAKGKVDLNLAHLRSQPRALTVLRPEVGQDLADLLARCLSKDPEKRPSATFIVDALRGETGPHPSVNAEPPPSDNLLDSLIRRRLPQIVAVTGVVGFTALAFVGDMEDRGVLRPPSYKIALNTYICAVAVSGVIAWFHGKKGRQKVQPLEVGLLVVIGLAWLVETWLLLP
jgi:serine/threonine protein kinase